MAAQEQRPNATADFAEDADRNKPEVFLSLRVILQVVSPVLMSVYGLWRLEKIRDAFY